MIPGEYFIEEGSLELNAGRETRTIEVANSGDRPIQVGSHYHFYETNDALVFDQETRPEVSVSTFLREPPSVLNLVRTAMSSLSHLPEAVRFTGSTPRSWASWRSEMATIARKTYADLYGPTKGDRVRLADTELIIEIEEDHTDLW